MEDNPARMVDISDKEVSWREALAEAFVLLNPQTINLIRKKSLPKGDVLNLAKCAGILAAKKVDELIPLAHPLPLEFVDIQLEVKDEGIKIKTVCKTQAKTGVEMEAMVAAAITALTIYDMCKSVDRGALIQEIKLVEKKGGKSGEYKRYP